MIPESLRIPVACAAWLAGAVPDWLRFRSAVRNSRAVQQWILAAAISRNAATEFGRAHDLRVLRAVRDFQKAVPIRTYEEIEPWIERMKDGEPGVLTSERVLMFEKTSGSSGAAKYIPYTARLRREFQAAIRAWMVDLHLSHPRLVMGPAYWCITPLARTPETTRGGTPVGFGDDPEYFTPREQRLIATLMAAPGSIAQIGSIDDALYATLRHLVEKPSLRFISVWSPSFLSVLIAAMERHGERLVKDLERGTIRLPSGVEAPCGMQAALYPDLERAAILRRDLRPQNVWPELEIISCWADGASEGAWSRVAPNFPGVDLQPKGLLATEGVTSIPFSTGAGSPLAVTSHFYEFLPLDEADAVLPHELEIGKRYSVILTTGGGLWRYDSGDLVEVAGWLGSIPRLRFVGRRDAVCDLVGEKLHAEFVGRIFDELRKANVWGGGFAMLAPESQDRYAAFVETSKLGCDFGARMDAALAANPQYAYARSLGQLRPLRVFRIREGAETAYLLHCAALGQRGGGIKPAALHRLTGWEAVFTGAFAEEQE